MVTKRKLGDLMIIAQHGIYNAVEIPFTASSWAQQTSPFGSSNVNDVAHNGTLFVAVGNDGKLATATNPTSWTLRTSSFGITGIQSVSFVNEGFLAGGASGKIAYSSNGLSWVQRTSPFGTSAVVGFAYSSGAGLYVAVGADGKLATSTDTSSWTLRTSSFGTSFIYDVTATNSLYVAVGSSGK